MSTNKKKVQLTHLAVVQDGTLRLVRVDGEDGLEELAALAVGENLKLADAVSAAVALADIVGHVGGVRPAVRAPLPEVTPLKSGEGHVTTMSIADANEQVQTRKPAAAKKASKTSPIKAKPGTALHKLAQANKKAGKKRPYNGGRPKRPAERRFTDDDLINLLRRAVHNEQGGLRGAEVARLICAQVGEEYGHKDPLVRSVTNRLSNMKKAGMLVRNDEGIYSLPVPVADWPETVPDGLEEIRQTAVAEQQELYRAVTGEEPGEDGAVDEAGDSVDNAPVRLTTPQELRDSLGRTTAGFGSVAGMNGLS